MNRRRYSVIHHIEFECGTFFIQGDMTSQTYPSDEGNESSNSETGWRLSWKSGESQGKCKTAKIIKEFEKKRGNQGI